MSKQPFSYGNPISDPVRFIGRSAELHQILTRLRNQAFESSSIIGERRIGKTSLLKILAQESLGEGTHFIYLDLQMLEDQHTPKDFWNQILRSLARCLHDDNLKKLIRELRRAERIDNFDLNDLFEELGDAGLSIVLLLDEFERVAANTNFNPSFFYGLRSLAIHHCLALVTTSYTDLSSLSHSEEVRTSPFFNIFATVYLSSFTPEEADELFERYLKGTGVFFLERDKKFLTSIAGYHPYYLQVGANFLFHDYTKAFSLDPYLYVKRRFADEADDTLSYSWRHASDAEKISMTVLALLSLAQDEEAPAGFTRESLTEYYRNAGYTLDKLARRGLVIEEEGQYKLFSTVFAEWIWNELRNTRTSGQAYEAWLKEPATRSQLARLKGRVASQLTARLLPKIKHNYRDLIIGWLISEPIVEQAIKLLQYLIPK